MDLTKAKWRKSSYSGGNGGNCVQIATLANLVAVQDSKNPGPALVVDPRMFGAFVQAIKEGQFTL
jgi:hypothetical protein